MVIGNFHARGIQNEINIATPAITNSTIPVVIAGISIISPYSKPMDGNRTQLIIINTFAVVTNEF